MRRLVAESSWRAAAVGLLVVIALLVLHAVGAVELDSTSLGLMVVALLLLLLSAPPDPRRGPSSD
jgi:hypothetical protein